MIGSGVSTPIDILLVEDNLADIELTKEALHDGNVANTLHVVRDGEEALKFLKQAGPFSNAKRPDLVLLDLNLPKISGREVLDQIKQDQALKSIPVIVLTTSKDEEDILRSYKLHANSYITKPVDFDQFATVIRSIEEFWLVIVSLPRKSAR